MQHVYMSPRQSLAKRQSTSTPRTAGSSNRRNSVDIPGSPSFSDGDNTSPNRTSEIDDNSQRPLESSAADLDEPPTIVIPEVAENMSTH